ncbi:MAG: hypothetical protein EBV28_06570 [Betaproteobacteria bacterium]|nr:hypothetical protein [Betaproteobacteria bacterium]
MPHRPAIGLLAHLQQLAWLQARCRGGGRRHPKLPGLARLQPLRACRPQVDGQAQRQHVALQDLHLFNAVQPLGHGLSAR